MKIILSDVYKQQYKKLIGLKDLDVIDTMIKPDSFDDVSFSDGSTVRVAIRKIPASKNGLHLIVMGQIQSDKNISVFSGLKVYADMLPDIIRAKKLDIVFNLMNRFGFDITIGDLTAKMHFYSLTPLKSQHFNNSVVVTEDYFVVGNEIIVFAKKGQPSVNEFRVLETRVDGRPMLQCALCYSLDLDRYIEWIHSH